MNKTYFIKGFGVMAALLIPLCEAEAAHLTPDQALQRVTGNPMLKRMPANFNYRLSYTGKASGEDMLYVFNKGDKGFMITSADDRLPSLLGYSDAGAFDMNKIPPQLKWWLGQYAEEAAYFLNNEDKFIRVGATRSERAEIPVLLKTKWDQGEPYNLDCPEDAGGRSVTGCVATAMAQVIKYHGYPATGNGQHSYIWNGREISFDYGAANFDYAEMLDEYNPYEDTSTEAQKKAVAELMYACGVSVNMNYSSDMSGAVDILVTKALREYFNYASSVRYLSRSYYTLQEWEDVVYSELEASRPVIYGGQAPTGGHEFVCDGYKDGLFHINWGWSGYADGYFSLSGLDPDFEGTGGFDGGYNSDQDIICGITPNEGEAPTAYSIYATGGLSVIQNNGNWQINLAINNGILGNYGVESLELDYYLKVVSSSGEEYMAEEGTRLELDPPAENGSISGYTTFWVFMPQDLPAGDYKAYLGFKTPEGGWQDVIFPVTDSAYLNLTVDADGDLTFTEGTPVEKATVEMLAFAPTTTVHKGEPATFNFTLKNTGNSEYSGVVELRVFAHNSDEVLKSNRFNFSLAAQAQGDYSATLTYDLEDGEYDAVFYDKYGDKISEVFPLWIGVPPVAVTGITLNHTKATMKVDETLELTATVLPEDAADKVVTWSSSNPEIVSVDENGLVTALNVGSAVITATSVVDEKISASCEITVEAKVIEVEGIVLDKAEATLVEGETLTLTVTIDPETATDKTLTWKSSDEEVATVEDGVVTAVAPGKATITVETANGKTATCEITVKVKVIEVEGIVLDKAEATLTEGETLTLTATIDPETATDKTLTWKSSDEEVATVEDGVVTAVAPGIATITVETANGKTATCEITVEAKVIEVEGIHLDKAEATLTEGETLTLTVTIDPETATDKAVTWKSSDETVATVEDGIVTAVAPGVATITVETANGKTATCEITVEAKEPEIILATSITLDKTTINAEVGTEVTLTATVLPEDATDKTVTWSSSNETVATVDSEGKVTILQEGSAVITATTTDGSDLKAECAISGLSGIAAIVAEAGSADVYTINGIVVKKNVEASFLSTLAKGTYIIVVDGQTYKIVK